MVLSLAFAAVLGHRICHSIVPNVEDAWCDTSCNGKTQNCVAEFCECEPSLHCKSLSKAVKRSWCNDNCAVGNCPATFLVPLRTFSAKRSDISWRQMVNSHAKASE